MLLEQRPVTAFLVGVLETDEDEVFTITKSVCDRSNCLLSIRSFGEMCSVPVLESDLVPGSIMGAFVTHPLHFEVLVALFELVEEVWGWAECRVVLADRRTEPASWPSYHTHERSLRGDVYEIML